MIFGALVVILIGLALAMLIIPVVTKPDRIDSQNRDQVENFDAHLLGRLRRKSRKLWKLRKKPRWKTN